MANTDAITKKYISDPTIFADAFNYLLYNGRQKIKASSLQPVDTTEIAVPYGNGAKIPVQKYRDNLKIWATMYDGKAVYVLLGCENQTNIHYAMPVRDMLYDSINYASQVEAARKSYKDFKFDSDGVKITLTSNEFLSGFRKGDKLIPVITAVILFDPEQWDAPTSIHEMLDVDEELLPFIPNYRINLISPAMISDDEFSTRDHVGKFHTGFGTLMQVIKHKDEICTADIIRNSPDVDPSSADIIEEFSNVKFQRIINENGGVNMCKGMEIYTLNTEIKGAVTILRDMGIPDDDIFKQVSKTYNVTVEYVKEIMIPKAV